MLTVDARLELFKKQFPKEKITSVQEREGQDHSVLEINHTWMCKSAKTQAGIVLLDREAQLLRMLQGKIAIKIPVPLYYTENFLVYKKIPGSPLIAYAFYRYGNKQRSKLVFKIAEFLSQLHEALTPEQLVSLNLPQPNLPWSLEKLQAHRHHLGDNKDLVEVFDNIMKVYEEELAITSVPTLIHNDMGIHNIIVDPLTGQVRGIIDFTNIALGDQGLDLRIRRENPISYTKAVALVYSMMHKTEQHAHKMYVYYFAAEFSRYFQYLEEGKTKEAADTLYALIQSMHEMSASHDECLEGQPCGHQPSESEAEVAL